MAEVKIYYQSGEPTDQTVGTVWIDVSGARKVRGTNGAWRSAGSVNLDNLGSVKREGDSMDGALQGAHGLAPLHDAPLTGNPTINDEDIATKNWVQTKLDDLQQFLLETIADSTKQASASYTLGQSIAFWYGQRDDGQAVPLPLYSSDVPASLSEIVLLIASPALMNKTEGYTHNMVASVDPSTLIVSCHWQQSGNPVRPGTANCLIVCMKK